MKPLVAPLLFGLVLFVVALAVRSGRFARENPGEPLNAAARAAREAPQLSTDDARAIAERYGTAHVMLSGLRYVVRQPGTGVKPGAGAVVSVHFEGRLLSGGKFDSSRDRGQPLRVRLGAGDLPAGCEEALADMAVGERRTAIVPWWLGYGERGRQPLVPAFATLVCELELLAVNPAGGAEAP